MHFFFFFSFSSEYSHVTSQQLNLQGDDGLADPDHGENTAEHDVLLVVLGAEAQEQTEQQAEDEGTPHIPVAEPGTHVALVQQRLGIHDAPREPRELLAGARQAGPAQVRIDAAEAGAQPLGALLVEHGAAEQVLGVQHLAHLGPDGQQVAPQRLPDRLVDRVDGGAAVLAADARRPALLVEGAAAARGGRGADVARQGLAGLVAGERVVEVVEVGYKAREEGNGELATTIH